MLIYVYLHYIKFLYIYYITLHFKKNWTKFIWWNEIYSLTTTPLLLENTQTPTTTTIRRLPDYNEKETAMKKLGVGSSTFNNLVSKNKIKTKQRHPEIQNIMSMI